VDQEGGLAGDGVQTDHVPQEPGLHCSGITVAGKAINTGVVVLLRDLARL
jgi:hypothetical protein